MTVNIKQSDYETVNQLFYLPKYLPCCLVQIKMLRDEFSLFTLSLREKDSSAGMSGINKVDDTAYSRVPAGF